MKICNSCGGVIGTDCFNPEECADDARKLSVSLVSPSLNWIPMIDYSGVREVPFIRWVDDKGSILRETLENGEPYKAGELTRTAWKSESETPSMNHD